MTNVGDGGSGDGEEDDDNGGDDGCSGGEDDGDEYNDVGDGGPIVNAEEILRRC